MIGYDFYNEAYLEAYNDGYNDAIYDVIYNEDTKALPGPSPKKDEETIAQNKKKRRKAAIKSGAITAGAVGVAVGAQALYRKKKAAQKQQPQNKGFIAKIIAFIKSIFKAIINIFTKITNQFKLKMVINKYENVLKSHPELSKKIVIVYYEENGKRVKKKLPLGKALKYVKSKTLEFNKELNIECNNAINDTKNSQPKESLVDKIKSKVSVKNAVVFGSLTAISGAFVGIGKYESEKRYMNNTIDKLKAYDSERERSTTDLRYRIYKAQNKYDDETVKTVVNECFDICKNIDKKYLEAYDKLFEDMKKKNSKFWFKSNKADYNYFTITDGFDGTPDIKGISFDKMHNDPSTPYRRYRHHIYIYMNKDGEIKEV